MLGPTSYYLAELGRRELLPQSTMALYLAGSLVRGWGNDASDLDIYVILSDQWDGPSGRRLPVPLVPATVPLEITVVDGRRWEITYWLDAQVDQFLARVSIDGYQGGAGGLEVAEYAFLERLTYARPLLGADWLAQRRSAVESSSLRSMVIAKHLDGLDNQSEDATGMLAVNDLDSAVLAARDAFGFAVDALLACHGELGYGRKWRARRVRSIESAVLPFDDYWSLETMRTFDPEDPGAWVTEVLRRCQEIAIEIST
jgi:hypothetical protein